MIVLNFKTVLLIQIQSQPPQEIGKLKYVLIDASWFMLICNIPYFHKLIISTKSLKTDALKHDFHFVRERLEENEQQNIAIMLMVVVMIFVLCNVLAMVVNILGFLQFNAGYLTKVRNYLFCL